VSEATGPEPQTKPSPSNVEWKAYAALDYGASHDLPKGIAEWEMLRDHVLRQYRLDRTDAALEVGCGGGRLTNAVAQDFAVVHACDIAKERLDQVKQVPNAAKIETHLLTTPVFPLESATVDLCFSTHVFQHIENIEWVNRYFEDAYRVLRPGGAICIHIPVVGAHGFTGRLRETLRLRAKAAAKTVALPVERKLIHAGVRNGLPWRLDYYRIFNFADVLPQLERLGFADVQLRILPWDGGHSYVFARKP
jgi:SAM-dependent methyltransferase